MQKWDTSPLFQLQISPDSSEYFPFWGLSLTVGGQIDGIPVEENTVPNKGHHSTLVRHYISGSRDQWGARIACRLERQTRDRKVASSNAGRSEGRIFFFRVNFVCWLLFGIHSTPTSPQWHVKDPSHSAKSAGGRLHLNMHKPLTQQSRSGLTMPLSRQSGNPSGKELTRNSSGNTRSQSSQLFEPLWTDPGLKE